jgi:enoyl-CoA hydratase/carnithine racemase
VAACLGSAVEDGVLVLTFDREDGLPRIDRRMLAEIEAELSRLAHERWLKGCVITGTERAFAVGANIVEISKLSPAEAQEFSHEGQRTCLAIERSTVPVVAAIRGYCMGGGLDIALACQARLASPDAVFSHPGGSLGILTGWGGTQRLARLIGRARALEMLTTGRKLASAEASSWGLVDAIVEGSDLLALARTRVERRALRPQL